MPIWNLDKLVETTVKSLRVGLRHAAGELLDLEPLDSEVLLDTVTTDTERRLLLDALLNDPGPSDADLQAHLGEPPIPADRRVHAVISGTIRAALPRARVVGEEAISSEWDDAKSAPTGTYIFTVDAIDGSLPYSCLGFGYSSNIVLHQRHIGRDKLILSAVANSSGIMALYNEGQVLVGQVDANSDLVIASMPLSEPKERTVAILGALPRHRTKARAVIADESAIVFTTAGAPASLGVLAGSLESLVAHSPQTLHDAAFLPAFAALHIPILTEKGEFLSLAEVESIFERNWENENPRTSHPCPAFIASRNELRAIEIATQLGWATP